MRKLIYSFILLAAFLFAPIAFAQEPVNVYLFHGESCPHCKDERAFFKLLRYRNSHYELHEYEVWGSKENQELLKKVAKELDLQVSSVPITIINGKVINGFMSAETTGANIEKIIEDCWKNGCDDPLASILKDEKKEVKKPEKVEDSPNSPSPQTTEGVMPEKITVPIVGEINVKNLSLPLFTVLLGALDGFNPCAMWALLFLISLLLGMKDRRRMWILGGTFIIVSAAVYFLFLAAWLSIFLFLGLIFWIRLLIGATALGSGGWNIRQFIIKKDGGCSISENENRRKFFDRFKELAYEKKFWVAFSGIIVLAAAVNLVELMCSAGLPAIYTQVLTMSNLSGWQYYMYLLGYVFFYMLDDIVVFSIAMVTLKTVGISTKYARWTNLIGGILMLLIGLLLIFKPGWLMFG